MTRFLHPQEVYYIDQAMLLFIQAALASAVLLERVCRTYGISERLLDHFMSYLIGALAARRMDEFSRYPQHLVNINRWG